MLRAVLRLAAERGTTRCEELARELGTSRELVRLVLEELVRRDYLQAVVSGGSTACERCPLRAACLYGRQPRVWMLTSTGHEVLATSLAVQRQASSAAF